MGSVLSRVPAIQKRTACVLFSAISGGILYFGRDLGDSFLKTLHLGCFSTWFGMQIWVVFVSGVVMYHTLPRQMFGLVQSKLFPKYFMAGAGLLSTTLATYVAQNPLSSLSGNTKFEGFLLTTALTCNLANFLVMEPLATKQMFECHKYEKEHGGTQQEIAVRISEVLKDDEEYVKLRKKFYRTHGITSMINMTSVVTCSVYLWQLQKRFSM